MEKLENELQFSKSQINKIMYNALINKEINVKELFSMALQNVMQAERKLFLKEPSEALNKGNGSYLRSALFDNKLLQLRVPRDRESRFTPFMLELIQENEEKLKEVAFKLYSSGLSTKEISETFDLIYGKKYSKAGISHLCEESKKEALKWMNRSIKEYYPVIYIDAHFNDVRRENRVDKEGFYVVLGVRPDFTREILAIENFPTESASNWERVFENLKSRGVEDVNLVVADGLKNIETAVSKHFENANLQLCVTHLKRNLLGRVRKESREELTDDLKYLFTTNQQGYRYEDAKKKIDFLIKKWGKKYPYIERVLGAPRIRYYFTYLNYHHEIQSMIYTTNWIERLNKSFKRVLRIRNSMPNPRSALALLAGVGIKKTEKTYSYPIYNLKKENNFK